MSKQRRLNKDVVVATAARLANQAGTADGLTLTELARALDVQVPSLYNHVEGRDGLLRELALLGGQELADCLRQAAFGRSGRQALVSMALAYRRFAHEQPGLYALTLRAPDPADAELVALSEELVEMLALVLASCGIEGENALHTIRGFRSMAHGFVSLEMSGGFGLPLSREDSFGRLVAAYLDGLAVPQRQA